MKAHTYYIIFGRPPIGEEASPFPPPGGATATTLYAHNPCDVIHKTKSMKHGMEGWATAVSRPNMHRKFGKLDMWFFEIRERTNKQIHSQSQ